MVQDQITKHMKVMKDKRISIENGLIVHENLENFCIGCHNVESPTFVEINIDEAWEKIKHPVPKIKLIPFRNILIEN